jgi:hypothetical protein
MRNILHFARPGNGKGICAAQRLYFLGQRSKQIYEKGLAFSEDKEEDIRRILQAQPQIIVEKKGKHKVLLKHIIRYIFVNYHLKGEWMKKYGMFYKYFLDPMDITTVIDSDIVFDEIATPLPSDGWKDVHPEIRRMFSQYRKRGLEIFAYTQDYKMVDINYRRMVTKVYESFKIVGSPDISATLPEVRNPWGVIALYELDIRALHMDDTAERVGFPGFTFIRKKFVSIYDTREDIKRAPLPPLKHMERFCPIPNCKFHSSPQIYHT